MSKLPRWLSDAFCRVATGAGIKTRKLYTDAEQQIFDICRPLLLNGIEDFATAGDRWTGPCRSRFSASTRTSGWTRETRAGDRRGAREIRRSAGCLVHGLQTIDSVKLDQLPRMADSAKWIAACLPGMGLSFDTWLQAYQESQNHGIETSLESSLTAKALLSWRTTAPGDPWAGTPKELYEALIEHVPVSDRRIFLPTRNRSPTTFAGTPQRSQKGVVVITGLHKWMDGVGKRVIEVASLPPTAPDHHPEEAAEDRPLDAESLTQDATLTHDFRCVKASHVGK